MKRKQLKEKISNCKIYTNNKIGEVVEKLLLLGFKSTNTNFSININSPFIFVDDGKFYQISSMAAFSVSNLKEIGVDWFLAEPIEGDLMIGEVYCSENGNCPFILFGECEIGFRALAGINYSDNLLVNCSDRIWYSSDEKIKIATEDQKSTLFSRLKKAGKCFDIKTMSIKDIEVVVDWSPKPFDRILARSGVKNSWRCEIYSNKVKGYKSSYMCVCFTYTNIIPFEGNEHLVGTKNNPKVKYNII